MICVCFLVSGTFPTRRVWTRWLREGREYVRFVVHASNLTTSDYQKVVSWCTKLGGRVVDPIQTEWAGLSVVRAEGLLFDECQNNFPSTTHYWLVSEKTIPCVSASRLVIEMKKSRCKDSSIISPFYVNGLRIAPEVVDQIKQKNWTPKMCSQFLVIHANHWRKIKETFWVWLQDLPHVDWCHLCNSESTVTPDEFVIQTLLVSHCRGEIRHRIVVCDQKEGPHADDLTPEEITWNCYNAVEQSTPLFFGLRKVCKITKSLLQLLQNIGVLDRTSSTHSIPQGASNHSLHH